MQLTLAKHKGEMMGIMLMESGYGSAIPSCVIAHMSKTGAAARSGLLNVGDHIISVNGVSLVGMPQKACIDQIKVGMNVHAQTLNSLVPRSENETTSLTCNVSLAFSSRASVKKF